jgi:hypothetical protein
MLTTVDKSATTSTVPNGVPESASKCNLPLKIAGQAYLDASGGIKLIAPEDSQPVGC